LDGRALSEHEFSETDLARYWDGNADPWADEVRKGHDVARERLNNPAFLKFIRWFAQWL
jgi:hypothetical protein